jgi:ubiquinone/menaquinone biosynthesis C-methylase UbiE
MLKCKIQKTYLRRKRTSVMQDKLNVKKFWNAASCGEEMLLPSKDKKGYENQKSIRYQWEPEILTFADFESYKGKKVLEIGVGLGCEHQMYAEAGAELTGIDLTPRAIENTKQRFAVYGLKSDLSVGDAESLSFTNDFFDLVYSWGVMHHSPNTEQCIAEAERVLKPGGDLKIMIYHKFSFVGYMLWFRYALMKGKPLTSLNTIYKKYLESPGTKAYSKKEAKYLLKNFRDVKIDTYLGHADLLTSGAGQRHRGAFLTFAKKIWPRRLIKYFFPTHGLFMTISAKKQLE